MTNVMAGTLAASLCVVALLSTFAAGVSAQETIPRDGLTITVLSSRPDLVTDGDALVEIGLPAAADPATLQVKIGQRDLTGSFAVRADGRVLGLVGELAPGSNQLSATVEGSAPVTLTITNHPRGGPLFSGPQIQPWVCTTDAIYHGLGPAQDDQCNGATTHRFVYRSAVTGTFTDLHPALPTPPDVEMITTDEGNTVPFIVRIERGTMNRGIYEIAILQTPDEVLEIGRRQAGWNGKLHVPFGGGCEPKHEQTGPPGNVLPGDDENWVYHSVLIERALERGYAVATSGLNVLNNNCNQVVSAEALTMLKEHVTETHGHIRFTTSEGCSGAGMQQYMLASTHPGLLDGITPACSFPDIWTAVREAADCYLLDRVFDDLAPALFADPADQAAIAGHASVGVCRSNWDSDVQARSFVDIWLNPTTFCSLPQEQVYDAETNRGECAARCRTTSATSGDSAPTVARTGRSTTSACSTAWRPSHRGRSIPSSSSR